jgi:hypothetical protein
LQDTFVKRKMDEELKIDLICMAIAYLANAVGIYYLLYLPLK